MAWYAILIDELCLMTSSKVNPITYAISQGTLNLGQGGISIELLQSKILHNSFQY